MRLLFIRHGDPDYVNDTLTEKGHREAAVLADRAEALNMGTCYASPLGRARATAEYSLKRLGKTAKTLGWLEEFPAQIDLNQAAHLRSVYPNANEVGGKYEPRIVWDVIPSYWTERREYSDSVLWRESEISRNSNVVQVYDDITGKFDAFLEEHGYRREGMHYRVQRESTETVTFFCHFGVTCALLAHLWNLSPFTLWHSLALAPTSVTEVVTEEREQGTAYFRGLKLGDVSHLSMSGEPVSFAARFCEVYSDTSQRH